MKRFVSILALLICFVIPTFGQKPTPAPVAPAIDFKDSLRKSTLAVYQGKQECKNITQEDPLFGTFSQWGCGFQRRFTCTATVVGRLDGNTYAGLTAGHCFNWDNKDEYYVADKIGEKPVLHRISLIKFENDERYDYGVFKFQSSEEYQTIEVDTDSTKSPSVGTEITNVNYAFGLVEETIEGKVVSDRITDPARAGMRELKGRYLVGIGIGPGASGSAVVDNATHKIVGLVVAIFPGTQMSTIVISTGEMLRNFTQDDSAGIEPKKEPKPPIMKATPKLSWWQSFIDWLNNLLRKD